jgi:negative regulator of sigma-B (phosphoserine phosphatase)
LKITTGVATLPLAGQQESGDLSFVKSIESRTLVAVVDALGHGEDAASAAHAAVATLDRYARESLPELVKRCHSALAGTRGVVLGIASFDPAAATMTWLGVGNIAGILMRADGGARPPRISLVPAAGFIGSEPIAAVSRVVALAPGDTLFFASDGIRDGFADSLVMPNTPQGLADHIMTRYAKGTDDALVLVARYAA